MLLTLKPDPDNAGVGIPTGNAVCSYAVRVRYEKGWIRLNTTKNNQRLIALIETAILVAMAYVLSLIKLWTLPNGGSITAVSMLPLVILGLRRGPKWAFAGCFVYGVIDYVLGTKYGFSIISLLCDYLFAWTAMGVAGFFRGKKWGIWAAIPAACFARFIFVFISGVTVWAEYAEGIPAPLYSASYNGSYIGIEMILMYLVALLLKPALPRLLTVKEK